MEFTPSWAMASQAVRNAFEEVLNEAAKLLTKRLGLTAKAAMTTVKTMRGEALEKALDRVMEVSSKTAVQPDFIIVLTTARLWVIACGRCGIPDNERPFHGVKLLDVPFTSPGVGPSPEHLMRIDKALEKERSEHKAGISEHEAGISEHKARLSEVEAKLPRVKAQLAVALQVAQKAAEQEKNDGLAEASK